jgi:hypothetical protein
MSPLPEDILIISYPELAQEAERRLHLLALIGVLLHASPGLYDARSLALAEQDWQALCSWLQQQKDHSFWQLISHRLQIIQPCEKHILVGTSLLLDDLRQYWLQPVVSTTINDIWRIARQLAL